MDATTKNKTVFIENLEGKKTAKDRFGTPMVAGEIIAYAVSQRSSARLKVGKILSVKRKTVKRNRWNANGDRELYNDQSISLVLQGADKFGGKWVLQKQHSTLQHIHNAIVLTNPSQEIMDLFADQEKDEPKVD